MGEICAMTDKEILDDVYKWTVGIVKNGDANVPSQVRFKEFKEFIERKRRTSSERSQPRDEFDYNKIRREGEWSKRKTGAL